jgi:hypothetical protein
MVSGGSNGWAMSVEIGHVRVDAMVRPRFDAARCTSMSYTLAKTAAAPSDFVGHLIARLASLDMAEAHVLEGERNIARQKELIAEMLSLGLDVSRHQDMLATFEETQRLHTEHAKQLKQELSILPVMIAKIATGGIEIWADVITR